MLKYRSATLLIRTTCPEVLLGMQTADELEDVRYAKATPVQPDDTIAKLNAIAEPEPEPEPEPEVTVEEPPPATPTPPVVTDEIPF